MSFIRYRDDGLFVCKKSKYTKGYFKRGALGRNDKYTDVWMIKAGGNGAGVLDHVDSISCPVSLIGKRVRLRVEIVEE